MTRSKLLPLLALLVLALVPVVGGPAASAATANRTAAAPTRPATDAPHRADEATHSAGMPRDRLTALSLAAVGLTGLSLALLFLQDRRRRSAEADPAA